MDLSGVVASIEDAYNSGSGLSIVRSGDVEGAFLYRKLDNFKNDIFRVCAERTLNLHFGPQQYSDSDYFFWAGEIYDAFFTADIITSARIPETIEQIFAVEEIEDIRAYIEQLAGSVIPYKISEKLGTKVYESGYLHRDMIPSYERLFRGKNIVLIGPNSAEIAGHFARKYQCSVVGQVNIPGQFSVLRKSLTVPLYPHKYKKILKEIDEIGVDGKLVLVGAGLAAKVFCKKIAERGGVALDVGSMMDA